jgi:hemerythrin-like domain-containing protein
LFDKFERAEGRPAKKKIVSQALGELKVHATIEEEIFYPAVRKPVGKDIMNEADEEHHVAKVLIAELESMNGQESHYDAKFTVLAENVRHHIKEEENEVFPKAKDAAIDFEALSKAMVKRKETLLAKGAPPAAEDAMVASSHGKGDSPAQAAHKTKSQAAKSHAVRSVQGS